MRRALGRVDILGDVPAARHFLSRRWILFLLAVICLTVLAWRLGEWQFHRLDDRQARNAVIRANETKAPADVSEVLAVDREVGLDDEWRLVTARGIYRAENQVIVRYRTRDGESGVDVVVPLQTADGTSVLVDRGWLQTKNRGADPASVPAPPGGVVEVSGWVRRDDTSGHTEVTNQSTRSINAEKIGAALGIEVYRGFIDLKSESPAPATALQPVELPELNNGPHFFYGLQWWFFGVLAVGGFVYLVQDEVRGRKERPVPLSQRGDAAAAGPDPENDPDTPPTT